MMMYLHSICMVSIVQDIILTTQIVFGGQGWVLYCIVLYRTGGLVEHSFSFFPLHINLWIMRTTK